MPPVLDRCVSQLRKRGVSQSSAFAICTSALQRAGRLPRARKESETSDAFLTWAKAVELPDVLRKGMEGVWPSISASDTSLLRHLRSVKVTDINGILGMAQLQSRVIHMNPASIVKMGNSSIWYGAVALHEAIHAVKGFGEHEATRLEQRFVGNQYGIAIKALDRSLMFNAIRIAALAQTQREVDVHRRHRRSDFRFLASTGFTNKVVRKILKIGVFAGKIMAKSKVLQRVRRRLNIRTPIRTDTHQFLDELPSTFDPYIEKLVTDHFHTLLLFQYNRDWIEKNFNSDYFDIRMRMGLSSDHITTPEDAFEEFVREANNRNIGRGARGPGGIVPALRRVGRDFTNLSSDEQSHRRDAIRELIGQASSEGLFGEDGRPTDSHVMMMLYGFNPIPDAHYGEEENQTQKEID